ncbi:MAG: hypothetical protein KBA38_04795 [Negativicutes bacterium]|jgi:signal transduction histidine kinase|nr:hypothetical protein [Negativicutes bacterium]
MDENGPRINSQIEWLLGKSRSISLLVSIFTILFFFYTVVMWLGFSFLYADSVYGYGVIIITIVWLYYLGCYFFQELWEWLIRKVLNYNKNRTALFLARLMLGINLTALLLFVITLIKIVVMKTSFF